MADQKATDLNEYIQNLFSSNGVQAPIAIEEWTGGWASIVGGVNGIPTAQQFNRVFYILNAILKEMAGNVSNIQRTANDALPKVNFTASAIVALLKVYGVMTGCNADLLDGKHADAFALKQHNHSTSDINSGVFPIERGGTGASNRDAARENLGAAPKQHNHSTSDINSGTLPIERGGTGASNKNSARDNLGAVSRDGDSIYGYLAFDQRCVGLSWVHANGDELRLRSYSPNNTFQLTRRNPNSGVNEYGVLNVFSDGGVSLSGPYIMMDGITYFGNTNYYVTKDGNANFARAYGAVYNDYAEWFPRGGETEPGDIIALDVSSQSERYVRADAQCKMVAGVHSDEYAMLIGGESASDTEDYNEKNIGKYIPVALAGRVMTRVTGPIRTGDIILPSDIPGVGRAARKDEQYSSYCVVGYAVESDDRTDVRRLRVRVGR